MLTLYHRKLVHYQPVVLCRLLKINQPYQVKVMQASAKINELAKALISEFHVDPIVGRFDNVVEDELATKIIEILQSTKA